MPVLRPIGLVAGALALTAAASSSQVLPCTSYFDIAHPTILDFGEDLGDPNDPSDDQKPSVGKLDSRLHDFNGDDVLDILMWGNNQGSDRPLVLLLGIGNRQFVQDHVAFGAIPDNQMVNVYDVAVTDVNGTPIDVNSDGHEDLIAARLGSKDLVYLNNGDGTYSALEINPGEESTYAICDATTGALYKDMQANENCHDDPLPAGYARCDRRWSTGISAADLDGDGNVDFVLSYRASPPRVYWNTGSWSGGASGFSVWQDLPAPPGEDAWCYPFNGTRDVQLIDIDGDSMLDVVFARAGNPFSNLALTHVPKIKACQVYLNTLTLPTVGHIENNPIFSFGYELNPPGDLDDQAGTREIDGDVYILQSPSHSITVADVDGDGDQDLVQPISGAGVPALPLYPPFMRTRIYLNEGGTLGDSEHRPQGFLGNTVSEQFHMNVEAVDIDGDGDLDIYEAGHEGNEEPDRLWIRRTGAVDEVPTYCKTDHFMPAPVLPELWDNTRYAHFADLDDDGRLDMVETNFEDGTASQRYPRIFWGALDTIGTSWSSRGVTGASGVPGLSGTGTPVSGQSFQLLLENSAPDENAAFFMSFRDGFRAYNAGIMAPDVDDPALILVPFVTPSDPSQRVSLSFTWPAGIPAGAHLYVQAWVQDAGAALGQAASNGLSITSG